MNRYRDFFAQAGLLYSAAIWGSTFFLVKDALHSISPPGLLATRFLIASALMFIFLRITKREAGKDAVKGLAMGMILFMVYLPQTIGLKFTTASNSGFITGLFVVFVPLMGWILFRQVPGVKKIISVILALAGLWVLTGWGGNINYGDAMTLVTAFFYGLHILFAGRFMGEGTDPYVITFQQFFVVGILSLLGMFIHGSPLENVPGTVWWTIIFLAVFPTLLAFLVQMIAQKFTPPVKVAIIFSMEPVFAALFAWTLGDELFSPRRALGGLIIVAAILLSEVPGLKRSSPDNI